MPSGETAGLKDYRTYIPDIKPRLPTFSGQPDSWEPFLLQLQLMSRSYGWSDSKFRDQLVFALKGEPLYFASHLPRHVRENTKRLLSAMTQRFGHRVLAETHRVPLQDIKQEPTESIQQYRARVSQIVSRAYPGIQGTALYESLSVEHMLKGLPNKQLAYETLVRRPNNVSQAVDMVIWQDVCHTIIHGFKPNNVKPDVDENVKESKEPQTDTNISVENRASKETPHDVLNAISSINSGSQYVKKQSLDMEYNISDDMEAKALSQSHRNHQLHPRLRVNVLSVDLGVTMSTYVQCSNSVKLYVLNWIYILC